MKLFRSVVLSFASFAAITVVAALTPLPVADDGVVHAAGPCGISGIEIDQDAEEQAFLTLINNYRAQNSLGPLSVSFTLSRASAWKSRHLGENAYFGHDDTPIGRTWSTRVRDCGYSYNTYIGENIAAGYGTAAQVFEGWRNSPGHNSNMLGSNYTTIGIGRVVVSGSPYGTYWTTVLGGHNDGFAEAYSGEVITPIAAPSADGTTAVGQPATAPATDSGSSGGDGAGRLRLDLIAMCEQLQAAGHPAYDRICRRR